MLRFFFSSFILSLFVLHHRLPSVSSTLIAKVWNNTCFAPLALATVTTIENLNLTNFATPYSTYRFLGTLTFPVTDLYAFSLATDGEVRLWIDDHLVIDGPQTSTTTTITTVSSPSRNVSSFLNIPFTQGIPQSFRLEYSNYVSSSTSSSSTSSMSSTDPRLHQLVPSTLILYYQGNYTPSTTIVPSSVFSPIIDEGWINREQLLDRFIGGSNDGIENTDTGTATAASSSSSSLNAWQTFHNSNMGSHIYFPFGFEISLTIGYINTTTTNTFESESILGNIQIFPQFTPAIVIPGLKSVNGSDYSSLTLKQYNKLQCDITIQSTVVTANSNGKKDNAGLDDDEEDLQILATANGTDCVNMVLIAEGTMYPGRTGFFQMLPDNRGYSAAFPGFPSVVKVFLTMDSPASVPVSKINSQTYLAIPLGNATSGSNNLPFSVGLSTSLTETSSTLTIPTLTQNMAIAYQRTLNDYSSLFGSTLAPGKNFKNNPYVPSSSLTLTDLWIPIANIIAWNTIYTPYEGIITPVTRAWDGGSGYTLFEWDNLFLALMSTTPEAVTRKQQQTANRSSSSLFVSPSSGVFLDIAYSNLMQILLARTIEGFVPNYASGSHISFDRTEPPVGAFITLQIYQINPTKGNVIVNTVIDTLLSWNTWLWNHRTGNEGIYTNLLLLGSDPNVPCSACIGNNTFAGARYESGLDNSAQYEFLNGSGVGFDPVYTHHMALYDVAFTALYISETNALISLLEIVGGSYTQYIPTLMNQAQAVNTSLNTYLWNGNDGSYSNAFLFNGTFHPRYAPTVFFPLLSLSANDTQATQMMKLLQSSSGFCVDRSYNPGLETNTMNNYLQLVNDFWNGVNDNAACVSDECMKDILYTADYSFVRSEAGVLQTNLEGSTVFAQNRSNLVPLYHYYSRYYNDHTLTTNTSLPDSTYVLLGQEGYCFQNSPPSSPYTVDWPTTPLSLWYSSSRHDYQTCGSPQCLSDVHILGYTLVNASMCTAWNVTSFTNLPCIYGNPSIQRSDPSYNDNTYWRGRNWGPHTYLVYQGLANYDYLPIVNQTKNDLLGMGNEVFLKNAVLYGHVAENVNGIFGLASDKSDASPYYTWGALFGYASVLEYLRNNNA